jgi:hypothetical protein
MVPGVLSPEVKRAAREAYSWLNTTGKVQNAWNFTSVSPHGVVLIAHLTIFRDSLIQCRTYRSRLQSYIEKRPKITGMSSLELCCFKSQEFAFSKSTASRAWSDIFCHLCIGLGTVRLGERNLKQHQLLFTPPIYWPHNCVIVSWFPTTIRFKHSIRLSMGRGRTVRCI